MANEEKKLNKQQKEAVKHGEGPLLIIAGAGTGKTTVITERIKWLVSSEKAKSAEILALTFTDKAAREMEERVDIAMPYGYTDMWISTFHSFCDRVLRQEALQIGLDPGYKLMVQAETTQFLIDNLFKFKLKYFRPLGNPNKFVDGMLQHFSRLKDEDVTPEEYLKYTRRLKKKAKSKEERDEAAKTLELANAYRQYEKLKVKEGVMDFGDLISNVLKLFRTRKDILKQYQNQFKYILVDEFQDTNYAQNELAMLLAGKKANLAATGDDDQCLPPDAKIATPKEKKRIDQLKPREQVLTAVGKGHTSLSVIKKVFRRKKKARLLTFITESGKKITVTDNHKMFCFTPPKPKTKDRFFVYLMHYKDMGWRLGVTNDLATRLRLERHADRILGIGSYKTDKEARFYEAYYAAKYGLPTVPFTARPKQAINGKWLTRLFNTINTEKRVLSLAKDLHLDLKSHHFALDGVTRGISRRTKINLHMCYRNYRSKTHKNGFVGNPSIAHMVQVETSNPKGITRLKKAGFKMKKAKRGFRFRFTNQDLLEVGETAKQLAKLTDGILDTKFTLGTLNYQHKPARVMPASHVLVGNYLPVLKGKKIRYERVINRKEEEKELTVYDLEIEKTHNFIADGVVVHNSIYRFRGAAVSNIIQFRENYPKAKIVVLAKNYRSTQLILDHAYHLIQNNNPDRLEVKEKINKKLEAVRKMRGKTIGFIHADRVENEAEAVAKEINELTSHESTSYDYKDIAILVRANNHADPFVRALARYGLPYQFLGPGQLFRQAEVKDLIAYLKILYNFEDDIALYRILSMDLFDINARDLAAVNNYARRKNLSLFEGCEQAGKLRIANKTKEQIEKFVKMVHRHLKLLSKETAGQILYYFLEDTGLLKNLTDYKSPTEEKQAQNISRFFDRLKTYEVDHEDASVRAVVDWINLSMSLGESPLASNIDWVEENRVNLLTVHSAKGLEFPVVFLVNLVTARFPTRERREQIPIPEKLIKEILPVGDYHEQEERRLFYVGMTRACDRLYLTAAIYYGEAKREKKISPFVIEALGEEAIEKPSYQVTEQLSILDFAPQLTPTTRPTTHYRQPISYLSYSQINTFDTCPLQYRYRYIQRIPMPPSSAAVFGEVIHKTLKDFYQQAYERKQTKRDLLKILDQNWVDEGYASKTHEKRMKQEAKRMLRKFYDKGYDPKRLPKYLEQQFVIKAKTGLRIGGRIDRVDETRSGMEIIDYKTGKVLDQKELDKSLQMSVYALAATDPGVLRQNPEDVILSFYFLGTGEKKSTSRTKEELVRAKKEIVEKAKEIEKSKFEPRPGVWCDFCEYRLICEAWS